MAPLASFKFYFVRGGVGGMAWKVADRRAAKCQGARVLASRKSVVTSKRVKA